MDHSIPESFHPAAERLIAEMAGLRAPEVVVRCLLRAYDRIAAAEVTLAGDEVVARAETMARGLLTMGLAERRLAS